MGAQTWIPIAAGVIVVLPGWVFSGLQCRLRHHGAEFITQTENGSRKKGHWLRAELTRKPRKIRKVARCLSPFLRRAKRLPVGPQEKGTGTVPPRFVGHFGRLGARSQSPFPASICSLSS